MNVRKPLHILLAAFIVISAVGLLTTLTLCWTMPSGWEHRAEAELGRKICFAALTVGSAVRALLEYQTKKKAKAEQDDRTSASTMPARRWG